MVDIKKLLPILLAKSEKLLPSIASWQSNTTLIHGGGREVAAFAGTTNISPGSDYYITIIDTHVLRKMRQDGFVYGAKVKIGLVDAGSSIKFIVLRLNGTDYDLVGQSETYALASGSDVFTYTFTSPIPCLVGDCFGVVLGCTAKAAKPVLFVGTLTGNNTPYKFADVTASNTLTPLANNTLNLEALTRRPYAVATGDSIVAGWTGRQSWYDLFTGAVTDDPVEQLQILLPTLNYQNHCKGAQTWAWVLSTGIVSALATNPKYVIIHCGVNDVSAGREWAAVLADMDAVKVLCDAAGAKIIIDEILPWTAGTDAKNATIRTWNASYASWCTTNSAYLVSMHDLFGQIRVATGELDDLATAYDDDGVHILLAGKQLMASLWQAKLKSLA